MKSRKNTCGRSSAHDGQQGQPSEEESIFGDLKRGDTKTIQLCRQVEEAVSCGLACSANPILRELYVVGVEPLRGAARLRVLIALEGENDYEGTDQALQRAAGYLRGEIAKTINRKRVPSLSFAVVPSWDDHEDDYE